VSPVRFRRSGRTTAFAVAVAAFVTSMSGVAWAPKNLSVHVVEAACDVKDAGSGFFLGSVTLTGFTTVRGQLFGVGTVAGSCTTAGRKVVVRGTESVLVPLTIQELSCQKLDLLLGDVSVASLGLTVKTAGTHLLVFPGSRGDEAKFCAAERLAAVRPVTDMLSPLGQLLLQ
jgi:hypothetical protein